MFRLPKDRGRLEGGRREGVENNEVSMRDGESERRRIFEGKGVDQKVKLGQKQASGLLWGRWGLVVGMVEGGRDEVRVRR
jgi:hypothetical protein